MFKEGFVVEECTILRKSVDCEIPGVGVDRLSLDVQVILRHNSRPLVDWLPGAVEDSAQHILGYLQE